MEEYPEFLNAPEEMELISNDEWNCLSSQLAKEIRKMLDRGKMVGSGARASNLSPEADEKFGTGDAWNYL